MNSTLRKNYSIIVKLIFLSCTFFLFSSAVTADEYLNLSETVAIGSASGTISFIGTKVNNIADDKKPVIRGYLPFEESFQRWLGGECKIGKQNFLDDTFGSAITPVASLVLLSVANLSYPRGDKTKDVSQDLFLFVTGVFATKGITDITKGIFTRERPFHHILKDSLDTTAKYGYAYTQKSFFSGHTSGAFFSVSFLNLRVREIMRQQMTKSEYDNWKWVSSGTLFGWASFVGLSRVHAYKHHLSDVIVGAAAGILISELFYNFNKNPENSSGTNSPAMFQIRFSF